MLCHIIQPLFLARPAGTPSSAHRGRTRPLPPPGEPPSARAAPAGTASTTPRSLGAPFENGSSQRHRGARWWLCRRTFRLMTCTDQNHPRNGVQRRFLSVGSSLQPCYLPPYSSVSQGRSNPPSKRRSLRSPAASNKSPTEIDAASQSSAHALTKCAYHLKNYRPQLGLTGCCSPRVPSPTISAFRSALYNRL